MAYLLLQFWRLFIWPIYWCSFEDSSYGLFTSAVSEDSSYGLLSGSTLKPINNISMTWKKYRKTFTETHFVIDTWVFFGEDSCSHLRALYSSFHSGTLFIIVPWFFLLHSTEVFHVNPCVLFLLLFYLLLFNFQLSRSCASACYDTITVYMELMKDPWKYVVWDATVLFLIGILKRKSVLRCYFKTD